MKRMLIAGALAALGATQAAAQWGPPPAGPWRHPRPFDYCAARAHQLHEVEERLRMARGPMRMEERRAHELREDLRANCGGFRWHPERGWHY